MKRHAAILEIKECQRVCSKNWEIIKKQITWTNIVIKKKVTSIVVNSPKIKNPAVPKKLSKTKTIVIVEDKNFSNSLIQSKKSPRELAIAYQLKRKKHQIR